MLRKHNKLVGLKRRNVSQLDRLLFPMDVFHEIIVIMVQLLHTQCVCSINKSTDYSHNRYSYYSHGLL